MNDIWDKIYNDATPFIILGALGGFVRALNTKHTTLKDTFVRTFTGGFASGLSYMYLSTTTYPPFMKGFFCGVVGILGYDLVQAIKIRLFKEITGEDYEEISHSIDSDSDMSNSDSDTSTEETEDTSTDSNKEL